MISTEIQKLAPSALVTLFEVDATKLGAGVLRFTDCTNGDSPVSFGGNLFTPLAFETEGWEWSTGGALPRPKIKLGNTNNVIGSLSLGFNDLIGAKITRIRTFADFLDTGSSPDSSATLPVDSYIIDRKTHHDMTYIEWEMVSVLDMENVVVPARQVLSDACSHVYRSWSPSTNQFVYTHATCPYAGAEYYDEFDNPTSPSNDRCGRKLSSCRLRFGQNGILPTWQMPAAGRKR